MEQLARLADAVFGAGRDSPTLLQVVAFASLAFRSDRLGTLVKGHTRVLVKEGQIDWNHMRHAHMSRDDLLGSLRAKGVEGPSKVKEARLERSGDVSVVKEEQEPRILEAMLEGGVLKLVVKLQ